MKENKRPESCTNFERNTYQNPTVQEIQQQHLWALIKDSYGSPEELAKYLDLGIEMLFYIEEDTFDRKEIQQVVSAIRGIVSVLREGE